MAETVGILPQQIVSGSAPTAIPSSETDGWKVGGAELVRTFIEYSGGVTACTIRKLVRNQATGAWCGDATTDQLDPLTPALGNDVRTWDVTIRDEISFQIVSVTGGTVTVYAGIVKE